MVKRKSGQIILWSVISIIVILIIIGAAFFLKYSDGKKPIQTDNSSDKTNLPLLPESNNPTDSNSSESKTQTGNFKITLKVAHPQYHPNQDITLKYTIENEENKTIFLSPTSQSIEIKNVAGKILNYSGGRIILLNNLTIGPKLKSTLETKINLKDYGIDKVYYMDGDYYTISISMDSIRSNQVILRIY